MEETCAHTKGICAARQSQLLLCVMWMQLISSAFSHAVSYNKLDFKLCQLSFLVFSTEIKDCAVEPLE